MAKIKVGEVATTANILNSLIEVNNQPFVGKARRMLFKLQPEIKYLQQANEEDIEAIADNEIDLGDDLPAPEVYIDDFLPILEKLCGELPKQQSQIEQMINESS